MKLKEILYGYPDAGIVSQNKKEQDRIKFYTQYYANLSPIGTDVRQKDDYIIIKLKESTNDKT